MKRTPIAYSSTPWMNGESGPWRSTWVIVTWAADALVAKCRVVLGEDSRTAAPEAAPHPWLGGWLLAASCLLLGSAWLLSYPAGLPGDLWAFLWFGLLALMWSSLAIAWAVLFVGVLVRNVRRRPLRAGPLAVTTLALALGVGLAYGAALRLRFEVSEPALREVVAEGSRTQPGERAGLYRVQRVFRGQAGQIVVLTHACALADCGFAYSPSAEPRDFCRDSYSELYDHLTGAWYEVAVTPSGGGCD
jgi:hypothetical protein